MSDTSPFRNHVRPPTESTESKLGEFADYRPKPRSRRPETIFDERPPRTTNHQIFYDNYYRCFCCRLGTRTTSSRTNTNRHLFNNTVCVCDVVSAYLQPRQRSTVARTRLTAVINAPHSPTVT